MGMKEIIGKTPIEINVNRYIDEISMTFSDGTSCRWLHYQDCCESVVIDDIVGDFEDLIGTPLLVAEERTSDSSEDGTDPEYYGESNTWTFYTFRSVKGSVDVRWHGSSNGYYSESVSFEFKGLN